MLSHSQEVYLDKMERLMSIDRSGVLDKHPADFFPAVEGLKFPDVFKRTEHQYLVDDVVLVQNRIKGRNVARPENSLHPLKNILHPKHIIPSSMTSGYGGYRVRGL